MSKRYKILITGSSGMLGIDLCQELHASYQVLGFDLVKNSKSIVSRFFKGDITDSRSVQGVIGKIRPDIVIHTAAWADVDGCELGSKKAYKINSTGTRNVALACKKTGATLIYISTDFVFNGKKKLPYKESDRVSALSVYGNSKLKGENAVAKSLRNYFVLRTSWLYGKSGKNFVDTIIAKSKTERSLKVVRDQVGSPTYTKYLAKAIHALIENIEDSAKDLSERFGVYHVSNSGGVSWYDYARTILLLTGTNTKVVPITSGELARPANRPAMSILDNSKFYKFTGYKMPGWKVALKEYLSKK